MSHGRRHQPSATEDVAAIRSRNCARASVGILIGRRCLAEGLSARYRAAGKAKEAEQKLADMFTYSDAIDEARKDAESWEERNGK